MEQHNQVNFWLLVNELTDELEADFNLTQTDTILYQWNDLNSQLPIGVVHQLVGVVPVGEGQIDNHNAELR